MNQRFAGKTATVFGGNGFLGSNLVVALVREGATVRSFDRAPATVPLPENVQSIVGDILDEQAVAEAVAGTDHIFAFAGGYGAGRSIEDPVGDLESSPRAQLLLLQSMVRLCPSASVVLPGSRLEYGRPEYLPVDEKHSLHGDSPYALHKTACAGYYRLFAEQNDLHTVVLRLSNPFGASPLMGAAARPSGVLNVFIAMALKGETIPLYGGGGQLRDFIFVDDVVSAALAASLSPHIKGNVLNIGSGKGVSICDAARAAVAECGSGAVDENAEWPSVEARIETGDFYFDVSAAQNILGWAPAVSLEVGIRRTVSALKDSNS